MMTLVAGTRRKTSSTATCSACSQASWSAAAAVSRKSVIA
jgi:hypothetical protein